MEFIVLSLISIIATILIVWFALKSREKNPVWRLKNVLLLIILETVCMLIGKYGANINLYWWIYYPIPMLLTILVPTVYFRMSRVETVKYLLFTFISAPFIHVTFSFLLGWKNYMPFIKIPAMWEL